MILRILLLVWFFASSSLIQAQGASKENSRLPTAVKLTYKAVWMGIRAGTGTILIGQITEREKRSVIPVKTCISTTGLVRVFLKVDDCLSSLLDPEKLTPYRFEEHIREVSYKRDRVIEFDRKENFGRVYRPEEEELVLVREVPIEEDFHDFMSWTFFLSTQKLEVGQTFTFRVLTYNNIDELSLEVKDRRQVSLSKLGKFLAFRLVPSGETDESIKKRGGAGEIWVDSEKRIPLVITMKIPGAGSFKLVLKKIESMSKDPLKQL